jgi:uncharacterized protein
VIPKFFGRSGEQLFGAYHPPAGNAGTGPRLGVVLCYPGPHEYRQIHWTYHRLAALLSSAGLHVLRFDYSCTGDSAGETDSATLERWEADIVTAAAELRDLSSVRRVALVGMRLGASLAVRACTRGVRAADLVLWDPVVRGADYVRQLAGVQEAGLRAARFPVDDWRPPDELLGHRVPEEMRHALEGLDLLDDPLPTPDRALVICGEAGGDGAMLATRLREGGVACTYSHVPDVSLAREEWHHDTMLCRQVPAAIVAHLTRRDA